MTKPKIRCLFVFERPIRFCSNLNVNSRNVRADVELWDSSGDVRFQSCWPAIRQDTHGVIFVFDPQREEQVRKHTDDIDVGGDIDDLTGHCLPPSLPLVPKARDLDTYYSEFVAKSGLGESQCVVFANCRLEARGSRGAKLCKFPPHHDVDADVDHDVVLSRSFSVQPHPPAPDKHRGGGEPRAQRLQHVLGLVAGQPDRETQPGGNEHHEGLIDPSLMPSLHFSY